jgi:uncharacterized membrane protein
MRPFQSLRQFADITDFSEKEKNKFSSERVMKLLFEMTICCLALLVIRVWRTHGFGYLFLTWNLFLAWIPFLITRFVLDGEGKKSGLVKSFFPLCMWMAFLPNAPYILTDLFHLHETAKIPMWYDLILILSFALTGMMLFYLSFLDFEKKIFANFPYKYVRWFRIILFGGVGYGIYLGRFLRFNSWDVLSAPGELVRGMYHSIFSSGLKETASITIFFSLFLYFGYKIFFLFTDHEIVKQNENNVLSN